MTTPVPSEPTPTPAPVEGQPVAPTSHDHAFQQFWEKNSRTIYIVCTVILIGIIAKGGLDTYKRYKDDEISRQFATCNTPEKLKSFAAANTGHPLAGIAKLRIADETYTAGNYTQAATDYQAAVETLKDGPFISRARLGVATAKLQAGQNTDAENLFNLIAKDTSLLKSARAEAAYQLASLAIAASHNDEALKQLELINSIDPEGSWARRALMLRMSLPAPVATANTPAISLPAKP